MILQIHHKAMIGESVPELVRDVPSGTAKKYNNALTFLRFLLLSGEEYGTAVSLVGIAPLTRNRLNFMSLFGDKTAALRSKQESSKCTDHNDDDFEGMKSFLCLRTNLIHACFILSSGGK